MKKLIVPIVVLMISLASASAQSANHGETVESKGARNRRATATEVAIARDRAGKLRSWIRSEVLPEMWRFKGKIDSTLAPADLYRLDSLRALSRTFYDTITVLNHAYMVAALRNDTAEATRLQTRSIPIGQAHGTLMEAVGSVIDRYQATLGPIFQEEGPKFQIWTKHVDNSGVTWSDEMTLAEEARLTGIARDPWERMMPLMMEFLLWDGKNPLEGPSVIPVPGEKDQ